MSKGKKIIGVRGDSELHAKLLRIVANTGADRSTIVRSTLAWLDEGQIVAIVNSRQGCQGVRHAP